MSSKRKTYVYDVPCWVTVYVETPMDGLSKAKARKMVLDYTDMLELNRRYQEADDVSVTLGPLGGIPDFQKREDIQIGLSRIEVQNEDGSWDEVEEDEDGNIVEEDK